MSLVRVVPMLAPIITKIPLSSEIVPDATRATAMDVIVELLCIKAVVSNPTNSDMKGDSAIIIKSLAVPSPMEERENIIKSMASRNSKRIEMIHSIRMIQLYTTGFPIYRILSFKFSLIKIKLPYGQLKLIS